MKKSKEIHHINTNKFSYNKEKENFEVLDLEDFFISEIVENLFDYILNEYAPKKNAKIKFSF